MKKRFLLISLLLAWGAGFSPSSVAHQVKIQNGVGATLHIEPNDIPLAGVPTDLWFALTQAGGTPIPLAACDCELTVYAAGDRAIATPRLSPTSAEGYSAIPGASVTFPTVGAYELLLAGTPADGEQFAPFELRFEVIVAGRAKQAPAAAEVPAEPEPSAPVEPSSERSTSAVQPAAGEVSASVETWDRVLSSTGWTGLAGVVGSVLATGIILRIVNQGRSPGGKS